MWVELGILRPGLNINYANNNGPNPNERVWVNTDHFVNVKFTLNAGKAVIAQVISTKPGGCDTSVYKDDDAERIHLALQSQHHKVYVDYEVEQNVEQNKAELLKLAEAEKLFKASKAKTKAK